MSVLSTVSNLVTNPGQAFTGAQVSAPGTTASPNITNPTSKFVLPGAKSQGMSVILVVAGIAAIVFLVSRR